MDQLKAQLYKEEIRVLKQLLEMLVHLSLKKQLEYGLHIITNNSNIF